MNSSSYDKYTYPVVQWLTSFIIGRRICPFADRPYRHGQIRLEANPSTDEAVLLEAFTEEVFFLESNPHMETTLFIMPLAFEKFESFWTFVGMADELLALLGLDTTFQLAHFHPTYCFEGLAQDDFSNRSHRSPYPILHILRAKDVSAAIEAYGDTAAIIRRNDEYLNQLKYKL